MSSPSLYSCLLLAAASTSCAALDTERNLAPLYSEHWTAGGGVGIEGLGGAVLTHRPSIEAELDSWAIRPLFIHEWEEGLSRTEFFHPLGTVTRSQEEFTWNLVPIARYSRKKAPEAKSPNNFMDRYTLLVLPLGLYFSQFPDGRRVRAAFPFLGATDGFLTFDRIEFALFPVYMRTERAGRTTWHWLFPFFSYTESDDGEAWRAWPLIGHNQRDGNRFAEPGAEERPLPRYDRWFFLWPIFQYQKNDQRLGPDMEETSWTVFPLIGRTEQGTFESTTILWPFIGYSKDPATGFSSLDLPWPLINIQEPGSSQRARRYRFWPFYSIYESDGMIARSWAWPLIQHRKEEYSDGERRTFSVLPFYQSFTRTYDDVEEPTQWQKLWPLWQHEEGPDHVKSALPALNPLWYTPAFDRHYGWLWELYAKDAQGGRSHERGWLGLWRREADEHEIRTSLGGLWSRRTYRSNGALTHENSLLFGLFRWRSTEGEGADLLPPALPGPGWPLRPSTELLAPPANSPAPQTP
ncbi:MAG: hypothetical protein MK291_06300 [Planctomycetes bacterium]|nr:hypothetical protein [Planctomycetota bacterium]